MCNPIGYDGENLHRPYLGPPKFHLKSSQYYWKKMSVKGSQVYKISPFLVVWELTIRAFAPVVRQAVSYSWKPPLRSSSVPASSLWYLSVRLPPVFWTIVPRLVMLQPGPLPHSPVLYTSQNSIVCIQTDVGILFFGHCYSEFYFTSL